MARSSPYPREMKEHHSNRATATTPWYRLPGQAISFAPAIIQGLSQGKVPMSRQTYPSAGEIRNRDEWRFADD